MAALRNWRMKKHHGQKQLQTWRSSLPKHQQHVVGKLDPFLLGELLQEVSHQDTAYQQDLLAGFPLTGTVGVGGLGEDIEGGQCTHGRQGQCAYSLPHLRRQCLEVNRNTVDQALRKTPKTEDEWALAEEVWRKMRKDIEVEKRAGPPLDIDRVDLSSILLVECFGIWEQHGSANDKR